MSNGKSDQEIRARVDAFVDDLSALVRVAALESVRDVLQGTAGAPRRGPGRPRKSAGAAAARTAAPAATRKAGRRRRRGRRSSEEVQATAARVLEHVRANPGLRAEDIGPALGMSSIELQLPMAKLAADGKVRTEGQRRGTRYFASRGGGRKAAARAGKKKTAKKARRKTGRGRRRGAAATAA